MAGSLGSTYFKMRDIFDQKYKNTWNIIEQTSFVNAGKKIFKEKNLNFYENLKDIKNKKIDIIILSGSLQYIEKPIQILEKMFKLKPEIIIIERLPILKKLNKIEIYTQKSGSNSYPCWFFSPTALNPLFKKNNYDLLEVLSSEFDHNLYLDKNKIDFCGYIYKKK